MRYLLWGGKFGLMLFWLALLGTWLVPVARPFGLLLGGLCVAILLAHLLNMLLLERPLPGSAVWLERLQLLVFGAFHRPRRLGEDAAAIVPPSEGRAGGGQTD